MSQVKIFLLLFFRYTWKAKEKAVYAFVLSWPSNGHVLLSDPIVSEAQTQVFIALLLISSIDIQVYITLHLLIWHMLLSKAIYK